MYECFHCLQDTVTWEADFDYADFGYEGDGIVHICHCNNCGARIEYRVPNKKKKEETNGNSE